MRIGVDVDGVLADSLTLWVAELNRYFNKNMQLGEIFFNDILGTYGITMEEFHEFVALTEMKMMTSPQPVKDAALYLNKINEDHFVAIVTARQEVYRDVTEEWLAKQGMQYSALVMAGTHQKRDTCVDLGLDLMIEDTFEVSVNISKADIPVLLLDTPYNRKTLPALVHRKYSWREIYEYITNL